MRLEIFTDGVVPVSGASFPSGGGIKNQSQIVKEISRYIGMQQIISQNIPHDCSVEASIELKADEVLVRTDSELDVQANHRCL